jgi:hypothetical protein
MGQVFKIGAINSEANNRPADQDAEFAEFWSVYPRKMAKVDAKKAWAQTGDKRPPLAIILTAVLAARNSESWRKDGGAYIPYPATWLRGERWDDVLEVDIEPLPEIQRDMRWAMSREGIDQKGRELGMMARGGENYDGYKARIFEHLRLMGKT